MNIYEEFSCYTKLPIRIDDVCQFIREIGVVDDIRIYGVKADTDVVHGVCRIKEEMRAYSPGIKIGCIYYAKKLSVRMRRIVVCKELLHLLDNHVEMAQTQEEVSTLIDEIVAPTAIGMSIPALSDQYRHLHALTILLPRDALEELKELHDQGLISEEDVATIAKIPESYARLALSPQWQDIIQSIR